jgi:type I restriction enzyme, S subunit
MSNKADLAGMNQAKKRELKPKLRFPEFWDAPGWKKGELGNLGELVSGLTYSPEDIREKGLLVLRSSNVQNGEICLEDNVYVTPEIKGANFSKPNDILICVRNGSKSLIGKNALVLEGMPLCTHGAFMTVFRSQSAKFVFQLFQTSAYQSQVDADLGATINSINGSHFIKYKFYIPLLQEQQKIADCLSSLDELITAQTQKLNTLKVHKKGLMQQLFPAEGETLPELRFPEFSDDWRIAKIGDFVESYKGGAPLTPTDFVPYSDYGVIPKKAIGEGMWLKIDIEEPTYCKEEFYKGNPQSVVDSTYLITTLRDLVPSGPNIGYIVKYGSDKKYILAQGVYGLKLKETIVSDFLIHFSKTGKYRKMMQSVMVGSTQVHIRNSVYLNLQIRVPTLEEQQTIADCLSSLDELITAQTQKIDTLKAHKKGLMQQLFPALNEVTG